MINTMRVVGVITARGGSKGLPSKNIRPLLGKPLIEWTIEAALSSKCIDTLVVSTDDGEIAQIARDAGARIPFVRPQHLASDTASSIDVVLHAIDSLAQMGEQYDVVVLLEPTSPLRDTFDIDDALSHLIKSCAGSVVSVCQAESHHPSFMYRMAEGLRLEPYSTHHPTALRRQEIEPVYFLDGTIYCSHIDELRLKRSFYHDNTHAYVVPKWKSLEVDDIYDFVMIEALFSYMKSKK